MRIDGRENNALRAFRVTPGFMPNSPGSCLVEWGNTRVLVTANVEERVPPFLAGKGKGWLTAEYAMLPGSTLGRKQRERQKSDSRSIEIQRLIGRSLRSVMDFEALGERMITIDCDVIEADGGTRTASITGGFLALSLLVKKLMAEGKLEQTPSGKTWRRSLPAWWAGSAARPLLRRRFLRRSGYELCGDRERRHQRGSNCWGKAHGLGRGIYGAAGAV